MVTELLIVWIVGVVAFFVLWAVLLKVIKRISEKKEQRETALRPFDGSQGPQAQGPDDSVINDNTNL